MTKTRREKIYFHETFALSDGRVAPAIKVGHSVSVKDRSETYLAIIPTTKVIHSFEVPGQSDNEKDNADKAYRLEQNILQKFLHLNVLPSRKTCEVVLDCPEFRNFIKKIIQLEKIKDLEIKKTALDRLFLISKVTTLLIYDKPTQYQIDLADGTIFSDQKVKEFDCEGRIQLNLNKKEFGIYKKVVRKKDLEKLLEQHRVIENYKGRRAL